jgi:hypothetical protein
MGDENTQPSLPEAWQRAVWNQLRDVKELMTIQAQEIKILRLRIERLESQVERLTDTQPLD